MSQPLSPINSIPAQLAAAVPNPRSIRASREFEASLIASLLQSAQKTFAALPGEGSFAGSENYDYMATQALGSAIAARGGFGIADMISHYLATHGDHK
ncbi:MAG TPA: rod-binding protein [Candidatus Eisenbacteria bacterium]|nr:rod-binding protein [Candidatus Eisenbacteria bacterium]